MRAITAACTILITLSLSTTFGQGLLSKSKLILPTSEQWKHLLAEYNHIPMTAIRQAEMETDSIIHANDCYKFIHNADTTKFMAFFVQPTANEPYNRLIRFGRTVHRHSRPSANDSIEYLGYILWGMKYEGVWYYRKDEENEFWDKHLKVAQDDFLAYVLDHNTFFNYYNKKKQEVFWQYGGTSNQFRLLTKKSYYLKEYAGYPEIAGWHKLSKESRSSQMLNKKMEAFVCSFQSVLWMDLHTADPLTYHTRYKGKYKDDYCLGLYNADRNRVLLPMLYYDQQQQPWLTYYVLKLTASDTTLYKWNRFPTRKVERKESLSLEIIDDIRTFLPNWNWGTVNMISTQHFWADNFNDADLQLIRQHVR